MMFFAVFIAIGALLMIVLAISSHAGMSSSGAVTFSTRAESVSFFSADQLSCHDQVFCHAFTDESLEPLSTAETRYDTEVDFRLSEFCFFGSDADIAGYRELASAAECETVDCRDDRFIDSFDKDADDAGTVFYHIMAFYTCEL